MAATRMPTDVVDGVGQAGAHLAAADDADTDGVAIRAALAELRDELHACPTASRGPRPPETGEVPRNRP